VRDANFSGIPPGCDVYASPGGGAEGGACADGSCEWRGDGECDDGGAGAAYGLCAAGTDCADCGTPQPQCAPGELLNKTELQVRDLAAPSPAPLPRR
jgi:hypothetical protein